MDSFEIDYSSEEEEDFTINYIKKTSKVNKYYINTLKYINYIRYMYIVVIKVDI